MAVAILRPNVDVTQQWDIIGGNPTAWESLDEAITDPTAGDGFYMQTSTAAEICEVGVETIAVSTVTQAVGKFYVAAGLLASNWTIALYKGAVLLQSEVVPGNIGAQWRTVTFVGSLTQAEVDDLRLRATGGGTDVNQWDTGYVELTYTPMSPGGGGSVVPALLEQGWL